MSEEINKEAVTAEEAERDTPVEAEEEEEERPLDPPCNISLSPEFVFL